MKTGTIIVLVLAVLVAIGYFATRSKTGDTSQVATSTPEMVSLTTPQGITFSHPTTYALATDASQVTVHPYIPPCDAGFDYCLFRTGSDYQGTNFESAGLSVKVRKDLTTERLCLNTAPEGFEDTVTPGSVVNATGYGASVFRNVGGGAAGHISDDTIYRVFLGVSKSCTEFTTRIGMSQFGNYPAGSIKEFTASDKAAVAAELRAMLDSAKTASTTLALP